MFGWDRDTATTTFTPTDINNVQVQNIHTISPLRGDFDGDFLQKFSPAIHRIYTKGQRPENFLSDATSGMPIVHRALNQNGFTVVRLHDQFQEQWELVKLPDPSDDRGIVNRDVLQWIPQANGFNNLWLDGSSFAPLLSADIKSWIHASKPWMYGIPDADRPWALIRGDSGSWVIAGNFPPNHPGTLLVTAGGWSGGRAGNNLTFGVDGARIRRVTASPFPLSIIPQFTGEGRTEAEHRFYSGYHRDGTGNNALACPWYGLPPSAEVFAWAHGALDAVHTVNVTLTQWIWPNTTKTQTVVWSQELPFLFDVGFRRYVGGSFSLGSADLGTMDPRCIGFRLDAAITWTGTSTLRRTFMNWARPPGSFWGGTPGIIAGYELPTAGLVLQVDP